MDVPPINNAVLEMTGRVVQSRAETALEEIFKRMPFDQEITFLNGERARIKKFIEPRLGHPKSDHPNKPEFAFDVQALDGSWHLEFFVRQTGWGGVPVVAPVELPHD